MRRIVWGCTCKLEQNIGGFHISMHQALAMQVLQGFEDFSSTSEEPRSGFLGQALRMGDDNILESEGADVLHHIEQ